MDPQLDLEAEAILAQASGEIGSPIRSGAPPYGHGHGHGPSGVSSPASSGPSGISSPASMLSASSPSGSVGSSSPNGVVVTSGSSSIRSTRNSGSSSSKTTPSQNVASDNEPPPQAIPDPRGSVSPVKRTLIISPSLSENVLNQRSI